MREVPPTAGLPLRWRDLLAREPKSLEESLARFLGVQHLRVECSGTAALVIALTALKRNSARRRVILPAYTCPLVAMAVLRCGLVPVLCDIRADDFQIDSGKLARLCGSDTLALIPTHLGGRIAEIAPVRDIARRHGAAVIEDAAQALGAIDDAAGGASEAVIYSLAVGKGLSIFEGGILVARDENLQREFDRVSAEIAPWRASREVRRCLELAGYAAFYRPRALPLVYGAPLRRALRRGNLIEAVGDDFSGPISLHRVASWRKTVGASALRRLPAFLTALASQAQRRLSRLAAVQDATVLGSGAGARGTWPFFMVLMPSRRARDAALGALWSERLGVSRLYIHALADYPYLAGKTTWTQIASARDLAARMLTVSNSPWLEDAEFDRIVRALDAAAST
jgi:dTDP-4-amino-4,6-dideoxygalactose transaminase